MAEVAVASKAAIKMRKETAGFVGAMIVAAIIALFYYQHSKVFSVSPAFLICLVRRVLLKIDIMCFPFSLVLK
ncbi:hypothetical protein [Hymenobacter agri]